MPGENDDVVLSGGDELNIAETVDALGESLFGNSGDFAPDNSNDQGQQTDDNTDVNLDKPDGQQQQPAEDKPDNAPANEPAATGVTAPKTWRPEAQAEFAKLPPIVQQEVLKREQEIFAGIEMYKTDAIFGKEIKSVLDPYLPTLEKYNIKPGAQVADMMQAHYTLAFGTEQQKTALLMQVAKDYNINLGQFAQSGETPAYVDPQVENLQKEINELKSFKTQQQNAAFEAKKAEITDHVVKFANDPKNVYFDVLANDIANLLRTNGAKTVEEAYDIAMYRNPTTRQQEIERLAAEKDKAAKAEAQEKANKAKKAASANIRSNASRGSGTTTQGSMDDTMEKTWEKLHK